MRSVRRVLVAIKGPNMRVNTALKKAVQLAYSERGQKLRAQSHARHRSAQHRVSRVVRCHSSEPHRAGTALRTRHRHPARLSPRCAAAKPAPQLSEPTRARCFLHGAAEPTLNLEYHFNQAAFTATDWSRRFGIGQGTSATSLVASELRYLRDYAADQQQPITRHSVFLRADWTDSLVSKLDIACFIDTDLHDGPSLLQISANYYLSDHCTVGS